jgi:CBS domain containing-hemolysin-like protein
MTIVNKNRTTREAVQLAREKGHFRLPVYERRHNQIIGVVSFTMWDLMDPQLTEHDLEQHIQAPYFVTANQLLDDMLPSLQQRKDHMAVVIDEFGSAIGMATLEDVLEEVVGEVVNVGYSFDQHLTKHKYHIQKVGEGVYEMDGRLPTHTASAELGIDLPTSDAHTIGGMMISHLRHIPQAGEYIEESGYRFTVVQVNERGIQRLRGERIY